MAGAAPSQPAPPRRGSLADPSTLMAIQNLELRTRIIVEGYWAGLHRSPHHGFSVEFSEYRQYVTGDDLRYLDWRLFARSDRYYIKKFEDETNLRCYLICDNSRSMNFSSLPYDKAAYANTIAATLARFLSDQGDAVGLMTFDEAVRNYLPARHRPGHLRHLMTALDQPGKGRSTNLIAPLNQILNLVSRRAVIVLISDMLTCLDRLRASLLSLGSSGHEVILFQVMDPAERHFSFTEPILMHDIESGNDMYIDPAKARPAYLRKLQAHLDQIQSLCNQTGISYCPLSTDQPLQQSLRTFLQERSRQRPRQATNSITRRS